MKYGRKSLTIILSLALILLYLSSAEAKWWIFGQSEGNVEISYLFLNKASFDETGAKMTLFREMLPDGKVTVMGKAVSGKGKIGSVRITLDGKETWKDANLSESGAFEFSFKPEMGKTYPIFIEISDTTGKTNDVAATARQVTLSDRNVMGIIREALDKMIAAYENHDAKTFMSLVGEDFAGDMTNLDRAIRKDFSSFDNIDLNYTLNNISSDTRGVSISLSFTRMLTSTKSGQSLKDRGITEFVFKMGDKGAKVYSMKNPLIFGVTGAPNVATGTVKPMTNDPLIIVDSRGNAALVPGQSYSNLITDDSLRITNNPDGSSTVKASDRTIIVDRNGNQTGGGNAPDSGSFTLVCSGVFPGFKFATGEVVPLNGDFFLEFNLIFINSANVGWQNLGNVSINTITQAPVAGYTMGPGAAFQVEPNLGNTYAFVVNGKYALLELVSYTDLGGGQTRSTYKYKYQPDGSRNF